MALLAMLGSGTAHPALPPAGQQDAPTQTGAQQPAAASASVPIQSSGSSWVLPPVRLGGILSYHIRRDAVEEQSNMQQGLSATLNASTNAFIWQPWFAWVNGAVGWTMSRESSGAVGAASSNQSSILTGSGQISVLSQSKFPFEFHFDRSDSRVSSDLALAYGYASQRYGFTQQYFMPRGNAMFGWDRNTQTSAAAGSDRQDTLQLNVSQNFDKHRLQLLGNGSRNTHELTGETAVQNNLALQHSYTPDPVISVENMANVSRSGYNLEQSESDTRLMQVSSLAFWRPTDQPLTVSGGARVLALKTDTTTDAAGVTTTQDASVRNANVNLGVNYDLTRFTRINAGANVNMVDSNGAKSTNSNQSLGASYSPASMMLGNFNYSWSTSANVNNQTSEQGSIRQLSLQLSHNLGRTYSLDGGSKIIVDGSQSLGASASRGSASDTSDEAASTQQLTHNASIAWDMSQQSGTTQMRLSASDSRALGSNQEFFQLVNFQASSNLPSGRYSSWNGSLTIQGSRQGINPLTRTTDTTSQQTDTAPEKGFVTTSSASISYQNSRMFGIARLGFASDLRLNSAALLPLLGSAKDQQTAAWDNRFDYAIGRTQLRVQTLISRSSAPGIGGAGGSTIYKSIMFSASRSFGSF